MLAFGWAGGAQAACPAIEVGACDGGIAVQMFYKSETVNAYGDACTASGKSFVLEEMALRRVDPGRGLFEDGWLFFEQGISCGDAPICKPKDCETLLIVEAGDSETIALRGRYDDIEPYRGLLRRGVHARRADCDGAACWDRFEWQGEVLIPSP